MKAALKRAKAKSPVDPEEQLQGFIDKFDAKNQKLIRDVRKHMRKRMPAANELVYDNYNFFVIAYCPTEKPTDSICSIASGASGVGLCFPYYGAKLPDPHKILLGSGTQNRFIRLESAATLARPDVEALVAAAIKMAKVPLKAGAKGEVTIRAVSAKQRPRRK